MTGWEEVYFRDILKEPVRNGIYKAKQYHGDGIKIINMGELFAHPCLKNIPMRRVQLTESEKNKSLVQNGDLIFARRSLTAEGAGKCSIILEVIEETTFESSIIRARPDGTRAFSLFLFYFFNSNYGKYLLGTILRQVAVSGITGSDLSGLKFLLPPLSEQKAIAAVLSSLDDKIDLLHRQNATLEAMAEALFRQWFVVEAKDEWEDIVVADLADINARSINKNFPYREIQYLDTGSLTEGKFESYQNFSLSSAPSRAQRLVSHNDILLSLVRPNQKHYGIIQNPDHNIVVSTGFCVITCDYPHFLYLFLTNKDMTEYLHSIAEGSTSAYPALKPSDIANLELKRPPRERLIEFSKYAESTWAKISLNQTQIRTLEKLRDTLLPKLMSGEVRVEF